jgi:hypothetical protein
MIQIRMSDGTIAHALFRGTALGTAEQPESLIFHGDTGSLSIKGSHWCVFRSILPGIPELSCHLFTSC